MNETTAGFLIAIITLATKYGLPAVIQILQDWKVDNPTMEDIEALKLRVPKPDTYFEGGQG
jgi:hypothetical protein